MKLNEMIIQGGLTLMLQRRQHDFSVPNISFSWLSWEADLISVTKAGYMHEYEIKCSKADFIADFKKRKHRHFTGELATKNPRYNYGRVPNYFTYVAPINAIPLCIPDYAGLIEVSESKWQAGVINFCDIRKPKRIHSNKVPEAGKTKMIRTLIFKYWNVANNLRKMQEERDILIKERAKNAK